MPLKTHPCIGLAHAVAIINYLHQRFTCIGNDQLNICCTCVNRIFKQFFYGTGRSLNYLACRYLVCNIIR